MMKKRILSMLLCAFLIFGLLPTTIFAADADNSVKITVPILYGVSDFTAKGAGTKENPYYYQEDYLSSNKTSVTVKTNNPRATVDERKGSKTFPLAYGSNTVDFKVTSADRTVTVYYRLVLTRNKQSRPNNNLYEREFSLKMPSSPGAADGKIIGFQQEEYYDYRLQGETEWTSIHGVAEITGLRVGTYELRYGESPEYKEGSSITTLIIRAPEAYPVSLTDSVAAAWDGKITVPASVNYGERAMIQLELEPGQMVDTIKYSSVGEWSVTVAVEKSTYSYDGTTFTAYFVMPSSQREISSITLLDGEWYSFKMSYPTDEVNVAITPKTEKDVQTQSGKTFYKKGNDLTVHVTGNANYDRVLESYQIVDTSTGEVLAKSQDGSDVTISMDQNRSVKLKAVTRQNMADFSAMEEQLGRVPKDLTVYTDDTRTVLEMQLPLAENMYKVTLKDQETVDNYAKELKAAIDGLEFKPGDFEKAEELLGQVPSGKERALYTSETLQKADTAAAAVRTAITENWNRGRQNEFDALTGALQQALDGLAYKEADYTKVEEALAKIPADLSKYTEESVRVLNDAKAAVVRGKNITEQAVVDGYALSIENAIGALVKKKMVNPLPPKTGDERNLMLWLCLAAVSSGSLGMTFRASRKKSKEI